MNRRVLSVLLAIALVVGMLPSIGTPAAAASVSSVSIAGTTLSDTGYYGVSDLTTKTETAPTDDANGYVHWDRSTGTLILYGAKIGGSGIRCSQRADLEIVLAEGTTSNVTTTTGSAVVSEKGSIRISGKGILNATGASNGIWCMYTVSIADGATLNAVGNSGMGIVNKPNTYGDGVIIDASAAATIVGATYGIGCEWSITRAPTINSENVTVKGSTGAFMHVPTIASGLSALASTGIDGENPEEYRSENNANYKWFQTTPPVTYNVSVTTDGNGTAYATLDSGVTGTEVELTATPNAGYVLKEWKVLSGGVTVSDHKFTIGLADVEIQAVFEKEYKDYRITSANLADVQAIYEGMAEVTENDGVITIKLTSDIKGRLYFNDNAGAFVLDLNGKSVIPGDLNQSICADHNFTGSVTITGSGTLKKGTDDIIYVSSLHRQSVKIAVQSGFDYFTAKAGEDDIFGSERNTEEKIYTNIAHPAYYTAPQLVITQGTYTVSLATVDGAQMRISEPQGLRFTSSIAKSGDFGKVTEYGTILIPTEDITDISELTIGATLNGHEVAKVPAIKTYAEDDESVTFTAVIIDIKEKNYKRSYTARAYAILEDGSVVYGDSAASRSIYQVAELGLASESATEEEKAAFREILNTADGTCEAWYELAVGRLWMKSNLTVDHPNGHWVLVELQFKDGSKSYDSQWIGIAQVGYDFTGSLSFWEPETVIDCVNFYVYEDLSSQQIFWGAWNGSNGFDSASAAVSEYFVTKFTLNTDIRIEETGDQLELTEFSIERDEEAQQETYTAYLSSEISTLGDYGLIYRQGTGGQNFGMSYIARGDGCLTFTREIDHFAPVGASGTFYIAHNYFTFEEAGDLVCHVTQSNGYSYQF